MMALESVTYIRGWESSAAMASAKTTLHDKFASGLTPAERTLGNPRAELYGGSWDQMLGDLRDRLKGKPYIFKLVNRIQDDIARIEKLSEYEKKHKINLAEFLKKKEAK